jgi:ribosomal protein S13
MFLYKQTYLKTNCELRNSLRKILGVGLHKASLSCVKVGLAYPYSINNLNFYRFNVLSQILNGYT